MFISNTIKTEIVTITPRLAKQLRDQNTGNRKISATNLDKIKTAMLRNEWVLNGEAIKISKDGRILDGQHRIHAAIETDTTFETLIVYGLPDDTQESMDTGKSRTAADALAIRGYKSATVLASIVVSIIRAEQWNTRSAVTGLAYHSVTTKQIVDRVITEPGLTNLPALVSKTPTVGLSQKVAGFLYYTFSNIDSDDAEHFFQKLISGEGLDRGHPILTLRNFLIALKSERGAKNQTYVTAMVIKAWNKYREGEQALKLTFRQGGSNPEPFPEAR